MKCSLRKLLLVTSAVSLLGACSDLRSLQMPDLPSLPSWSQLTGEKKNTELSQTTSIASVAERARLDGDLNAAADLYALAIVKQPKDVALHARRGFVLLDAGKARDAEVAFRHALVLQPNHADSLRGLGTSLLMQDRTDDAVAHFKLALAAAGTDKPDYRIYVGLGVAFDLKSDHKAAQLAYRAGLKDTPDNLTLANNLGLSLALSGKHKEAIAVLNKVVASERATPKHRQNLAMVYGLAGQRDQAAKLARNDIDAGSTTAYLAYYDLLRSMKGWSPAPPAATEPTRADDPGLDTVPLSLSSRGISANE